MPWIQRSASHRFREVLARVFGIDPRTLAVFRMAIGFLLLLDLAIRATDLGAMYTDTGMFPRLDIARRYPSPWNWSFHFASGEATYQAGLFGLAAILALSLLAGFGTRWATIGSWLMLVSLQHRIPPVLNGGDGMLRMLLFWSMFLPLGRVWSVDAWRSARRGGEPAGALPLEPVVSVASAAILLQMALMYFVSAIYKSNLVWWRGQVIAGTLAHDFYVKPAGEYFLQFPSVLTALTLGVFVLEWLGPVLLFCPTRTLWFRLPIILSLAAMHVAIEILLTVGLFSLVSIAGLSLFLPSGTWQWFRAARDRSSGPEPIATPTTQPPASRWSWAAGVLSSCALVYVLLFNLAGLPGQPLGQAVFLDVGFLRTACGLGQRWNMFDEVPSKDGWYVAWAKLRDGSEVDLLQQGRPVTWSRPEFPAGMFPNHRWRKSFREMAYTDAMGYQVFRAPAAAYLRRRWDALHPGEKQVAEMDLVYCMETKGQAAEGPSFQFIVRERLTQPGTSETRAARGQESSL
ncbi:MAG: HTTM domain-containing protein [Verrucomicrobiales bacterium]|nr:HTTM domain-containing protein [Verrucomicrobiales bacterium]